MNRRDAVANKKKDHDDDDFANNHDDDDDQVNSSGSTNEDTTSEDEQPPSRSQSRPPRGSSARTNHRGSSHPRNLRNASTPPQLPPAPLPTLPSSSETRKELRKQMATFLADPRVKTVPTLANDFAFTRNQLRNAYLKLLFNQTFSQAAHGSEKALWSDTTYKIFDLYRTKLSTAEQALHQATPSTSPPPRATKGRRAAAQECTRIANALRNFLAREETFWKSLAERLATVFKISEAHTALQRAGIITQGPRIPIGPRAQVGDDNQPSGLARMPSTPQELDSELLQMATLTRHRQHIIEVIYNVIIFCGDLARYREHFREVHAGSDSASGTTTPPRRPNRSQHAKVAPDYTTAILYYDAARLFLPHNGHASHQIAITSAIQGDNLASVYHYYRALCVKHPFTNAQQNLNHLLKKHVDSFLKSDILDTIRDEGKATASASALASASLTKRRSECYDLFTTLQAWFFLHKKPHDGLAINAYFLTLFKATVGDKVLPTDAIVRIVVTSIAASWWARLSRREAKAGPDTQHAATTPSRNTELNQLLSLLEVAQVLFDITTMQSTAAMEQDSQQTDGAAPGQHLTPVTRRTFPALRILNKWLKSHLDYLARNRDLCERDAAQGDKKDASYVFVKTVDDLWSSFVDLINTLRRAFPYDSLPLLDNVGPTGAQALTLEEDVDLRGFIPTRRGWQETSTGGATTTSTQNGAATTSANTEQLMRIADILIDAKVIAESEASPISFDDERNVFVVGKVEQQQPQQRPPPQRAQQGQQPPTATSNLARRPSMESIPAESVGDSDATEDVVDMAMRAVQERSQRILAGDESVGSIGPGRRGVEEADDDEDDDDEDEIFIPAMARDVARMDVQQKVEDGLPAAGTASAASTAVPPSVAAAAIASRAQSQSPTNSRTAQDIFLQMLNGQTSFGGGGGGPGRWGGSPSSNTPPTGSATSSSLYYSGAPASSGFGEIGSGRPSVGSGSGSGTPVNKSSPGVHQRNTFQALPHPSLGGSSIWGGGGVWGSSNPAGGAMASDPWTVGAYTTTQPGFGGGGWNGSPSQQRDAFLGFEQSQQQQYQQQQQSQQRQQQQQQAAYLRPDPWAQTPR